MADPFQQAALDSFDLLATVETFTPPGGASSQVRVIYERGVTHWEPGGGARVTDRRTRAHLLVSEVGRPARGSTITDGLDTLKVDEPEQDDGIVVVCLVR